MITLLRSTVAVRFTMLLAATLLTVAAWSAWVAPRWRLVVNVSASLPGSLYLLRLGEPAPSRGMLVAFRPPPLPGYHREALFLKYVAGVPGDVVRIDAATRGWRVNDRLLGHLKRNARDGRALTAGPSGTIPPRHYAVWSAAADSYDSRYADIGWIAQHRLVARAYPLL